MKAVIAVPPVSDFYFTPTRASALGAITVKQVLESFGIETSLFNFPVMKKKPAGIPLPRELQYLDPFILKNENSPVSFFSGYKHFGPDFVQCAEMIVNERPDVLFISCFAWAYAEEALQLAGTVKELSPEIITAAGGAGVSVYPDYFRRQCNIDFVLEGEAERVLPEFVKESFNINTPKNSQKSNTDLPFNLAWNVTGISKQKQTRFVSISVTRGCPKACRFCANHLVHGRSFKKIPMENIGSELGKLPDDMKLHLNFEDDNLLFDSEYFIEVLEMIKQQFPDAEFSAENGLDYSFLTEARVDKLISLGFKSFNLSMASADQSVLNKENRVLDSDKLIKILNHLKDREIGSITYFICGLEGDTPSCTIKNLLFLHNLPTLTGISMFYPVPGIPSFRRAEMFDKIPPRLCAGSSVWPWTGALSTSQLITAFRLSRLSNMLKTFSRELPEGYSKHSRFSAAGRGLSNRIFRERCLLTIIDGQIRPVPNLDNDMVANFLDAIDTNSP